MAGDVLDVGTAVECSLEAMQLASALNDVLGLVLSHLNLGVCCAQISLHTISLRCIERALSITERWKAEGSDSRLALYAECMVLSNQSDMLLRVGDIRAALVAARRSQQVGRQMTSDLPTYRRVQTEDAMATAQGNEVAALIQLGMIDAAIEAARSLDPGSPANWREMDACLALARLDSATGRIDRAIEKLQALANDPTARNYRREALVALATCYESSGSPAAALFVLEELQAEVDAARREVALEELRRIDGMDPAHDDHFEQTTRSRIASYRVAIDGIDARLSSKLHYLSELAVSAEIREGNEEYRAEHIYRVGALCSLLAGEAGSDKDVCWLAEVAGRLHDVEGKAVPDAVVLQARALSDRGMEDSATSF